MVEEILRGKKTPKALAAAADLPPLNAADREYLFLQLLEGVVHGWQQPRVVKFFAKIKHRVPKAQWLDWLTAFGEQLVAEPNPSEDLARRMIQLSDLDCGEVTNLAGDYGHRVLSKIYGGYTNEFLPELEGSGIELGYLPDFGAGEMDLVAMDLDIQPEATLPGMQLADLPAEPAPSHDSSQQGSNLTAEPTETNPAEVPHSPISPALSNALNTTALPIETNFDIPNPFQSVSAHTLEDRATNTPSTSSWDEESTLPTFGEVPAELRLSNNRSAAPPPPSAMGMSGNLALDDPIEHMDQDDEFIEERQISIEEFDMMLRSDSDLLQQIAQQLGLETTDPQVVIDRVMAQMQEQIQDSGQL